MKYELAFDKEAIKQLKNIKAAKLTRQLDELLGIISLDPYQTPPPYKVLIGDKKGVVSRRINKKHRLTYLVDESNKLIKIISLWSHYENFK